MKGVTFGSVAEFRNGANYSAGETGPLIKMVGVGDFGVLSRLADFSTIKEIRMSSALSEQDWLKDGDLLFVRSNGNKKLIGRCMLMEAPPDAVAHSGFTIRARVDTAKYSPKFVATVFQTEAIHKQAHLEGTGTNISNLSQQILSEIRLPALDLAQQTEFLSRVDVWSGGINAAEELLSALERRKQGLMQQLLTGRRRLKGLKGKWKPIRVGSFADDFRSINTAGQALPVLSCTKYAGLVDSLQYFNKQVFSENTTTYKIVKRGQFVYATNHIEEGSIGYQDLFDAALVSPMYTVFEPDAAVINHQFLYMLLKTEAMRRVFEATTHSSVDRRGSLRWPEFAKLKINIPPMPEQERIVEVLSTASRAVDLAKQQFDELKAQKRALMQKLLSGEWRVPEAPAQSKPASKKGLQPPNNVRKQLSKM